MHLALVSKQLNNEMMPVLFRKTRFLFRSMILFDWFLRHTDRRFPSLERLRYIERQLDPRQLLRLVKIELQCRDLGCRYQRLLIKNSFLKDWVEKIMHLTRIRITLPHINHTQQYLTQTLCQKKFCLVIWAELRTALRQVPRVELRGHIDETQKQEWLEELVLERRGSIPDKNDLSEWQDQIWRHWYVCCTYRHEFSV